ncbi:MAG: PKD domain-containing protein [Deltaproteobacteria bacterium]|nr:PKD domain-containing protein [Deltaproteobacteria bacterium]
MRESSKKTYKAGLLFKFFALFLFLSALTGCSGGSDVSLSDIGANNYATGSATIKDGVTTLDSSTASTITVSDNTSVTFTGSPSAMQTLKPGDIFIVNNAARKVESVTSSSSETVVATTEPDFSEVVKTLEVSGVVWLGEEHIDQSDLSSKARLTVSKSKSSKAISINTGNQTGNTFTYDFIDTVVYDADGKSSTTSDQLKVNGNLKFERPHVGFDFSYGFWKDKYASISFNAGETLNLTFSSEEISFSKKVTIPLGSLVIPIDVSGLSAGTVYVKIPINLVFEANGTAKIVAGFSQSITIDVGMEADLSPVTITPYDNSSFDLDFQQPQIDGKVSASAAIKPDVDLMFLQYNLAGIENSLGIEANAKANLTLSNACYRVTADANLSSEGYVMLPKVSFNGDFSWDGISGGLDFSMKKYPKELFSYTKELYDSGEQCAVENEAPVADAGSDAISNTNAAVLLDSTGSYDNDGTIASYQWTQTEGSQVSLTDADTATPSFTAPAAADTLSFQLTVTDNNGKTATDYVNISVMTGDSNYRPTANAGADQSVNGGTTVSFDGSGSSDRDGSIASYAWTQTGGTNVSLTNSNTTTPSFTAPNNTDTLTFKLTVTDDKGATATDYVQVFVTAVPAYSDPTDTTTTGVTITVPTIDTSGGSGNIQMYASVVIQDGTPLENLNIGNFTLKETINSATQAVPITSVTTSSSSGSSISTALVLDSSGSMYGKIDDLKAAAKSFIDNMKDTDYAAIIEFDDTVNADASGGFTNSKDVLKGAIDSIADDNLGQTCLYDAIYEAVTLTVTQSGQKAIVAMTDGVDSGTSYCTHTQTEAIDYAVSNGIPVYTVGLGVSSTGETALINISDGTHAGTNGSGYYSAPTSTELSELYNTISNVLSNVYIIGWSSGGSSGNNVSVEITVTYTGVNGTFTESFTSSYVAP